jgi:hypothetical protein
MLIEAAKGGHTAVVGLLLDYPRSVVMATPPATGLTHQQLPVSLDPQVGISRNINFGRFCTSFCHKTATKFYPKFTDKNVLHKFGRV